MLLPAELWMRRFGSKLVIAAALIINGGLCIAMPNIVNKGGWIAMCNTQFLMGLTQACVAPANRILLDNWLPPSEKSIFSGVVYGGAQLGMILAFPLMGHISTHAFGWKLQYYAQAMMILSMATVWLLLTSSSPQTHTAVGDKEKEYIDEAMIFYHKTRLRRPWRRMLSSQQFWAIACAHAASNAVYVFYLTDVPLYLQTLRTSLDDVSLIAMLPFLGMWFFYLTTAPTLDCIYKTGFMNYILNTTYFRKVINGIGVSGTVLSLLVVSNLAGDSRWQIILLIASLTFTGFQLSGFLENYRDLSYHFSGSLVSLGSAAAALVGATVPLVTGCILGNDVTDMGRWRMVFLTLATFCVVCNAVFSILGSSERAHWDKVEGKQTGYHNDVTELELAALSAPKPTNMDVDTIIQ